MKIFLGNREIDVNAKKVGIYSTGLMFKSRNTSSLVFEVGKKNSLSLTSVFCFFSFLAVWLDSKNKVVYWREVRPFELIVRSNKEFSKVIEIPINSSNRELVEFFRRGGKV